jgi:putative ATP-binding cassette transporter
MSDEYQNSLRAAWRLARPYWWSEDKWRARGLLIAVIALNLVSVGLSVRFNVWNRDFFNSIQGYDFSEFKRQFLIFGGLAGATIVVLVYQIYLQQMLQIRWRQWLTSHYLDTWLDASAYYRLQLQDGGTDNPDQRISDDLNRFTTQTISLAIGTQGFLNAGVTLVSFLGMLWSLSGDVTLIGITIPGYMVWFALIYAVGGTWLTFKIGRPLVSLNFAQQRFEADFRFSMMRLRENAESVALYGGERRERRTFLDRFVLVVNNFWSIMKRTKRLNWYTSGYNQLAIVFPYIVAAPRYFAKRIALGDLTQTADAFGQVQQSLSFIINSYSDIAEWQSVVQRLESFDARARAIAAKVRAPQKIRIERTGGGISVAGLDLQLPDQTLVQRDIRFDVGAGEWLLITAPVGAGKSTLLRAMAGIWPFGSGDIRIGKGRILFLPQRPYIPLGTLRDALLYPDEGDQVSNERLSTVLVQVGLGDCARDLDATDNWTQRFSPGEQQRLAFARILLAEPAYVFLMKYALLRKAPWKPTVISAGHRGTLGAFHGRSLALQSEPQTRPDVRLR